MLRKMITIIATVAILAALPIMAQAAAIPTLTKQAVFTIGSNVVQVDGQPYQMDVAPFIDSVGRTEVPVRYLADVLGATNVGWNPNGHVITLSFNGSVPVVTMSVGSQAIYYSGGGLIMDTAPQIVPPGRTMLPARFVAQALNYQVAWDAGARTVTISPPKPVPAGTVDGFVIPPGTLLQVTGDAPSTNPKPTGINMILASDKGSVASQLADIKTILSQAPYLDTTTVDNAMEMIDHNAQGKPPLYLGVFNSPNGGGISADCMLLPGGKVWMSVEAGPAHFPPLPSTDESIWPKSSNS